MKLRVWHIPQIPMNPFYVKVESPEEAVKILNTLWDYDLFQYENNVKPDYSNMSGLQMFNEEENDWEEWDGWDTHDVEDINELVKVLSDDYE